jgi:hypothetical protein
MRRACIILVGERVMKKPIGRIRTRWKDDIKMCFSKVDMRVSIHFTKVKDLLRGVANMVMKFPVTLKMST